MKVLSVIVDQIGLRKVVMIKTNYKNKIGTSGDIMAASKIIKEIK